MWTTQPWKIILKGDDAKKSNVNKSLKLEYDTLRIQP